MLFVRYVLKIAEVKEIVIWRSMSNMWEEGINVDYRESVQQMEATDGTVHEVDFDD